MTQDPPFHWLPGQKPSIAETAQVIALGNEALKQLDDQASEQEISLMFDVLSGARKSSTAADEKATALGYFFALDGVSQWGLKTAIRDVIKGKAKGFSTTFMPSATDLFLYCEQLENGVRKAIQNIFQYLERSEIKPKSKGEPISAEKFDELKQMLAAPDSAEAKAYFAKA
ncbi:hypothetical protein [Bartonella sp. B17]